MKYGKSNVFESYVYKIPEKYDQDPPLDNPSRLRTRKGR